MRLVGLVSLALLVIGCGRAPGATPLVIYVTPPPTNLAPAPPTIVYTTSDDPNHPAALVDSRFVVDQVSIGGATKPLLPAQTNPDGRMRVDFSSDDVGVAGCNWWSFSPWSVENGLLVTIGDTEPSGTFIGCPGPDDAQDHWLLNLLRSAPAVAIDGDVVTVSGGDTVVSLAFEACTRPLSLAPIADCASVHKLVVSSTTPR